MRKILVLFGCCFALAACNSSSGSGSGTATVAGYNSATGTGTGIWVVLTIRPECGASTGSVSIGAYNNGYASAPSQTISVANGGSANFPVATTNYYTVTGSAGSCSLSGTVPYQGMVETFDLCLGSSCQQYAGTTIKQNTPTEAKAAAGAGSTTCTWGTSGCTNAASPGSGNVTIQRADLSFITAKNADLTLDLSFTQGNNLTATVPSMSTGGWKFTAQADGSVKVGANTYPNLSYDAQVSDSLLQFTDGFCDTRDNVTGRMSDYLTADGFAASTVSSFKANWGSRMPPNANLCVYPQGDNEVQAVVSYKASANTTNHRMWFIVIPQEATASTKVPAKFVALNKPKNDAFATLKTKMATRSVANTSDVTVEETAVGFLIEK